MIDWGIENGYINKDEEFKVKTAFLLIMGTILQGGFITKLRDWIRKDFRLSKENLETINIQWKRLKDNGLIRERKFVCEDENTLGIEIVVAQTVALGYMEVVQEDDSN